MHHNIDIKFRTRKYKRNAEIYIDQQYIPEIKAIQKVSRPTELIWAGATVDSLESLKMFAEWLNIALDIADQWDKEVVVENFLNSHEPNLSQRKFDGLGTPSVVFYKNTTVRWCEILLDETKYSYFRLSQRNPSKERPIAECKIYKAGGGEMKVRDVLIYIGGLNLALEIATTWNKEVGQIRFPDDGIDYKRWKM